MTETRDSPPPEIPRILARGQRTVWLRRIIVFITGVLLLDALVGDQGLAQTLRARRERLAAIGSLAGLRHENAELRDQIRRLQEDPRTIEAVAREDLGLIKPGEILVVVHDQVSRR